MTRLKFVLCLICVLLARPAARGESIEWTRQLGTYYSEQSNGVSADGLGNVYISGYTQGSLDGTTYGASGDAFVSKYDAAGTLQWTRQLGTLSVDDSWGVSADRLGSVYISGRTIGSLGGPNTGGADAFVSKYDAAGILQWTRQWGTSLTDLSRGVSADGLGNVYISGYTGTDGSGFGDAFISKYDAAGLLQWTQQLGTNSWGSEDWRIGVSADGLGSVYISGYTGGYPYGPNASLADAFVSKYDVAGTLQWSRQFGTSADDRSRGVSADGLGNVYISGYTGGEAFVSKYDAAGTLHWSRQLGTTDGPTQSNGVSSDGLGNVFISGFTGGSLGGPNAGEFDAFVSKYDAAGTLHWTRQLGTSAFDRSNGVSADGLGNVYFSGWTSGSLGGPSAGGSDTFVAKIADPIIVPEPNTILLLGFAAGAALVVRARFRRPRFLMSAPIVLTLAAAPTIVQAATLRTVALSGVTPGGIGYGPPVLNDAGQVAFTNRASVWSEGSGSLTRIAQLNDHPPGTPDGVRFGLVQHGFANVVLNDAGQVAFYAELTSTGVNSSNNAGFWSEGSGSLALVARGNACCGPMRIDHFRYSLRFNDAGQTALLAGGSLGEQTIWSDGSGSLAPVMRVGTQAPGMPTGINFGGSSAYDISYPELNDIGQIAFRATTLTGSGVDPTNNSGIWLDRSGSLALVVREGDHPPGMPSGVTFGAFGENSSVLALNNASQIAFRAPLTGTGVVPFVNDAGIWSEGSGSLALVARTGDPAPGLPSGVNFDTILHPALNNQGQIAFQGYLVGTGVDPLVNSRGIWFGKSGSLAMVARAGDHAPGAADGVNFSRFYLNVLNDAGQIAFGADLTDNRYGIWATDRSGAVQVIALEGGPLEVAPGDFRTINDLQIGTSGLFFGDLSGTSGNSDGRSSAFNNRGQFAFYATFTDGSRGIFVSNRVAIPEPSAITLAVLGTVCLVGRAHRRVRVGCRSSGVMFSYQKGQT